MLRQVLKGKYGHQFFLYYMADHMVFQFEFWELCRPPTLYTILILFTLYSISIFDLVFDLSTELSLASRKSTTSRATVVFPNTCLCKRAKLINLYCSCIFSYKNLISYSHLKI